ESAGVVVAAGVGGGGAGVLVETPAGQLRLHQRRLGRSAGGGRVARWAAGTQVVKVGAAGDDVGVLVGRHAAVHDGQRLIVAAGAAAALQHVVRRAAHGAPRQV